MAELKIRFRAIDPEAKGSYYLLKALTEAAVELDKASQGNNVALMLQALEHIEALLGQMLVEGDLQEFLRVASIADIRMALAQITGNVGGPPLGSP